MKLIEIIDDRAKTTIKALNNTGATNVKIYNMDTGCTVFYCVEKDGKEHVSISHRKRLPNWNEVKYVRYELMKPDVKVAQILPPKSEYVDVHTNCFHLWELSDEEL